MIKFCLSLTLMFYSMYACSADLPGISEFIDQMVNKHNFQRTSLQQTFEQAQYQQKIIDAMSRPARSRPWSEYRSSFVNAKRIKLGVRFWQQHQATLRRAEREYQVPAEIIVALIGVETIYGRYKPGFRTIDALTTLAFAYPRRAEFFRTELENYLLLAQERNWSVMEVRSSYAGALGFPQFMPSSYRQYAVDFDKDNNIDLLHNMTDVIGSVANYVQAHGWEKDGLIALPAKLNIESNLGDISQARSVADWHAVGIQTGVVVADDVSARLLTLSDSDNTHYFLVFKNFDVIRSYNNSDYYVMSVWQLAEAIKRVRKKTQSSLR